MSRSTRFAALFGVVSMGVVAAYAAAVWRPEPVVEPRHEIPTANATLEVEVEGAGPHPLAIAWERGSYRPSFVLYSDGRWFRYPFEGDAPYDTGRLDARETARRHRQFRDANLGSIPPFSETDPGRIGGGIVTIAVADGRGRWVAACVQGMHDRWSRAQHVHAAVPLGEYDPDAPPRAPGPGTLGLIGDNYQVAVPEPMLAANDLILAFDAEPSEPFAPSTRTINIIDASEPDLFGPDYAPTPWPSDLPRLTGISRVRPDHPVVQNLSATDAERVRAHLDRRRDVPVRVGDRVVRVLYPFSPLPAEDEVDAVRDAFHHFIYG